MSKTILVTGVNGFVGHHLTRHLKARGCAVIGVGMQPKSSPEITKLLDEYCAADLTEHLQVKNLPLTDVDAVISLAGLAKVGESFNNPDLYMYVNTAVIRTICEIMLQNRQFKTRHLVVSTGAVYDTSQKPPFAEDARLAKDTSPYVLSKIAMEKLCQDYSVKGLDLVVVRPFNHIGPGQETGFILPDLIEQVRQAISGSGVITVGNLKTKRDYTDVRDVARAYAELITATSLEHDLYNICSGKSLAGQQLLDMVLRILSPKKQLKVVVDKSKIRSSDATDIYGSCERLKKETGWSPIIALEKTIEDTMSASKSSS